MAALIVVAAWPGLVDAHAIFVGAPASVAAGSDVALTMNVPHERDDTTYNVGVAIGLPDGWAGVACQTKPTWSCSIGVESGQQVIRFDKEPAAAPAEDETFHVTAHVGPTPGTVSFPTLQSYSTGETVAWVGPPGSDEPAPTLDVVASSSSPTTAAPTTSAVGVPSPSTSTSAAPVVSTAAPPSTAAPVPTVPISTASITPSTSTSAPTTSTTSTTTTTISTTSTSTLAVAATAPTLTEGDANGGGSTAAMIAIVLGIGAAGAATIIYLRRRAAPVPPT